LNRQIGVLVTRKGEVAYVLVGDDRRIWIPDLSGVREGSGRLRGLRCLHTHLHGEPLSKEDLMDLVLLKLDLMVSVLVNDEGNPGPIHWASILPREMDGKGWLVDTAPDVGRVTVDFLSLIRAVETELAKARPRLEVEKEGKERAILVGVAAGPKWREDESLEELYQLARSDGVEVAGRVVQQIKRPDARFLIGRGKLSELVLRCLQTDAGLLIFNHELTPAQARNLAEFTDLKIIDRSQLILDIFARRAVTREGKIQVELAQLRYLLPRLATKDTGMSRLTGGIGGTGPGETKLEINRRRVRERIARLNRELGEIRGQREQRRRLRNVRGLPVISIVGYTNAGKSTLLNSLTESRVGAGDRLFETLDPSSRRLRFPREQEAIITDTVGFIRELPEDLMEAFAATLEELRDADLLLHVVDASSPQMDSQREVVAEVLGRLGIAHLPTLLVLNKTDLVDKAEVEVLARRTGGVPVSAIRPRSLVGLVERIETVMWPSFASRET
jgi:GTP-binding protein HflX